MKPMAVRNAAIGSTSGLAFGCPCSGSATCDSAEGEGEDKERERHGLRVEPVPLRANPTMATPSAARIEPDATSSASALRFITEASITATVMLSNPRLQSWRLR